MYALSLPLELLTPTGVFTRYLYYWKNWFVTRDGDHILLNVVRDIIACWTNTKNMMITKRKRESLSARFPGLLIDTTPPWSATKVNYLRVENALCQTTRLPKGTIDES
jgi:hypothetical protein